MNIIGRSKLWLGISGAGIVISILFVSIFGLNFSSDFTGGSVLELAVKQNLKVGEIEEILSSNNLENSRIFGVDGSKVTIRTKTIQEKTKDKIISDLQKKYPKNTFTELRFVTTGPTISQDLIRKAVLSVIFASLAIILYVWWSFRDMPRPANSLKFGVVAIAALMHDSMIVFGVFALLGRLFGAEIDSLFITAILTVMGYSVNDTIVVFDRIREELIKRPQVDFQTISNTAVVNTMPRSLNTSLTTLFALLVILLLGGSTTQYFVLALIVGISAGTYSSIFIAAPLVTLWQDKSKKA